ncbi:hypothetical protein PMAYCL1PPCAC_16382, partial [Pristionchus mayeri]
MEEATKWSNVCVLSIFAFVDSLQFSFYMWSLWPSIQQLDPSLSTTFLGFVMAISGVGEALAAPIFGYWSNRIGRILPAVYASLTMSVAGNGLYLFIGSIHRSSLPLVIVLSRFLTGASAGNRACLRALPARDSQGSDRSRAMAVSGGATMVGLTIGPAVQLAFNYMGDDGASILSQYTAPALLAIYINLSSAIYIHYFLDDSLHVSGKYEEITASLPLVLHEDKTSLQYTSLPPLPTRMDVVAVVICVATRAIRFLATANIESVGAPFTEIEFNFTHSQALEWNSTDQAIVGALTIPTVRLHRLHQMQRRVSERRNCLFAIAGLFSFYLITMPWAFLPGTVDCSRFISDDVHDWSWCASLHPINRRLYFPAYALIYGICLPMLNNSLQSLFSRVLGDGPQGTMQGINQAIGSLGRILGPLVMASTFSNFGPQATWSINICLFALVLIIWMLAYGRLAPLEPRSCHKVYEMHSRPDFA